MATMAIIKDLTIKFWTTYKYTQRTKTSLTYMLRCVIYYFCMAKVVSVGPAACCKYKFKRCEGSSNLLHIEMRSCACWLVT